MRIQRNKPTKSADKSPIYASAIRRKFEEVIKADPKRIEEFIKAFTFRKVLDSLKGKSIQVQLEAVLKLCETLRDAYRKLPIKKENSTNPLDSPEWNKCFYYNSVLINMKSVFQDPNQIESNLIKAAKSVNLEDEMKKSLGLGRNPVALGLWISEEIVTFKTSEQIQNQPTLF